MMLTATLLLEPDGHSTSRIITAADLELLEQGEEQAARDRTAAEIASLEALWAVS
jgi:hypothetical protein